VSVRKILLIPVIVIVASAVVASAASLDLSSSRLGAGSATVGRCQAGPTPVEVELDDESNATITGIDPECTGSNLQLVLLDEDGVPRGHGSNPSIEIVEGVVTLQTNVDESDLDDVASATIAMAGRP
jgi:hypothetical protein